MQYVYLLAFTPGGTWDCAIAMVEIKLKTTKSSLNLIGHSKKDDEG
jgi:hypothetical protein